ncbi:MAG: L-serine ammonia-lyase [Desulfonatronovibrio sp.]
MSRINLSLFELFKTGPGPSSSHTIGPMSAGLDFRERMLRLSPEKTKTATGIRVRLLGSLSATGKGHGTDRAIAAGLLGWLPDRISPEEFSSLLQRNSPGIMLKLGEKNIPLTRNHFEYGPVSHEHPYSNTLILRLLGGQDILLEQVYYSVGGGFIQWPGYKPVEQKGPAYPYESMVQFLKICDREHIGPDEVILANESAVFKKSRQEILAELDSIMAVMDNAVTRGLKTNGVLPGPIGLSRKAPGLYSKAFKSHGHANRMLLELNAFALAAAEENASGGIVVTAPTLGAAGVLPAVLRHLRTRPRLSGTKLRKGLCMAAAIGFLVKHNASIAGAEVGCQGEIGTASAMAAAMLCTAFGFSPETASAAAEIALEHHLGLTCDPVSGYVQIPCIERNAMGAVKAYNAFLLASAGDVRHQKVGFDAAVKVMLETGRDMSDKYKETAAGGLAVNMAEC